jgi:hypothetical protein
MRGPEKSENNHVVKLMTAVRPIIEALGVQEGESGERRMKRETPHSAAGCPGLQFEWHRAGGLPTAGNADGPLPWKPPDDTPSEPVLAVGESDGLVYLTFDDGSGTFTRRDRFEPGGFALMVRRRHFTPVLAMLSDRDDVLINALPSLPFSVLRLKDSLAVGSPGHRFYVTARFTPYIGPPTPDMIGKRCPLCKIPIQAAEAGQPETRVVTCRCGAVFHAETAESHPGVPEEDRLDCFSKASLCPCCQSVLSSDEVLVWDPTTI